MLSRGAAAFAIAAGVGMLFNAALAITKEALPAVNKFLTAVGGHHWIGHGICDLVVFFAVGGICWGMGQPRGFGGKAAVAWLSICFVVSSVALGAWYAIF